VVLLAATNRPDVLDPALTRPGRLSRKVVVPLPDQAGRAAILGVHLKEVPLEGGTAAQDVAAAQLAAVTPNFSGGCAFWGVSAGPACGVVSVTSTAGVQHLVLGALHGSQVLFTCVLFTLIVACVMHIATAICQLCMYLCITPCCRC
jgi:hypothetical protein